MFSNLCSFEINLSFLKVKLTFNFVLIASYCLKTTANIMMGQNEIRLCAEVWMQALCLCVGRAVSVSQLTIVITYL